MSIDKELEKLAASIAEKALADTTPLAEKLDALAKLTTYYALVLKTRGKDDGADDEPTIDGFQAQLREAEMEPENGGERHAPAGVPARRSRRFATA